MINYSTANAPLQKELDAGEHTISIHVLIILPWLLHSWFIPILVLLYSCGCQMPSCPPFCWKLHGFLVIPGPKRADSIISSDYLILCCKIEEAFVAFRHLFYSFWVSVQICNSKRSILQVWSWNIFLGSLLSCFHEWFLLDHVLMTGILLFTSLTIMTWIRHLSSLILSCWVFADDVGNTAAFLASPLACSISGTIIYVDNGLHAMGLAVDSPCVAKAAAAPSETSNVPAWSLEDCYTTNSRYLISNSYWVDYRAVFLVAIWVKV